MPDRARVVIVGGGIVGCSAAYHLVKAGCPDVLLLEQNHLAGGTTWHAAGMVTRLRTSHSMAVMNDQSARLYAALGAETGVSTGWKQVGSLLLARSRNRLIQHRRAAATAALFGIECYEIGLTEAESHWPGIRTDDLTGAFWLPDDGRVDPAATARSLAAGAAAGGAAIREGERVTSLVRDGRRVTGVLTSHGIVQAETVLLCAGMWSRQFGIDAGIDIPLHPVEHHYAVTEPIVGVDDWRPCSRDHDGAIYFRTEGTSIVLGAFQPTATAWQVQRVPDDFSFALLPADWASFEPALVAGRHRLPALGPTRFRRFVNGPESFTPDGACLLGPAAGVDGLYIAAGFNSAGIATAGGAGQLMAAWILDGEPPLNLWSVDPRRFSPQQNTLSFLRRRVTETLGMQYRMAWPQLEFETARGLRRSALHDRLVARGAHFGSKFGWERPLYFDARGDSQPPRYSFDRPSWFGYWEAEHRATRERVALFDQSSFAKFALAGPDAGVALNRMCGNDLDVPPGRIVYTALLNRNGRIESDLTVIREAEDRFSIITSTAQGVRDFDWIERQMGTARAQLVDVTAATGVLGVMGPRARALLQPLTDADLSHACFPFGTARTIDLGPYRVLAARITYVGELGWELHVPTDQLAGVFDLLDGAGAEFELALAGTHALNSLRLEKGFSAWGTDLSTDDSPLEAGLGFAVAHDKAGGFLAAAVLRRQRGEGIRRRLVTFVLDDPQPLLWGGEPIVRNGGPVGYLTSGSYGHTVGAAIGMGYLNHSEPIGRNWINDGEYRINIAGELARAAPHLRAPYDPGRSRILC